MKKKIITIAFLAVAITASLIPSVMFFYCLSNKPVSSGFVSLR